MQSEHAKAIEAEIGSVAASIRDCKIFIKGNMLDADMVTRSVSRLRTLNDRLAKLENEKKQAKAKNHGG